MNLLIRDGYECAAENLDAAGLSNLAQMFDALPPGRPGHRLSCQRAEATVAGILAQVVASRHIGRAARVVRAVLFDKRDDVNWALGWHQDRTIEVAGQAELPGYGPFTTKQGRLHVAPPIGQIERMLTIRIHLDAVDADNAPLVVSPGTHRLGFIPERDIEMTVARHGEAVCLAKPGSIWLYSTPILHRSARSAAGRRRRVLQMDFAADGLPGGLRWARDAATA